MRCLTTPLLTIPSINHPQTGILSMNHWQERIVTNPEVCHGTPCLRGTRILVSVILDNLAEGLTAKEIVQEYSHLTPETYPFTGRGATGEYRRAFVSEEGERSP
jgi:uncharacterized protein (DUF433 family)